MNSELQALQDTDFGWARSLDSVWSDDDAADAGPNQSLVDGVVNELSELTRSPNPPGRVFVGPSGHRQDPPCGRPSPESLVQRLLVRHA
jgi:hypothetical protein